MKKKRRLIKVLVTILALFLVVFIVGNLYVDSILNKMSKTDSFNESEVMANDLDGNVANIALFGVDQDDYGNSRADVIKVISLNFNSRKLSISSIQRDNLVYQPMQDRYEKLNHAYAYDGPKGAVSALNFNLDLDITGYVKFDFDSVVHIIDILGGVDVNLSDAEASQIGVGAGLQHLNGTQALAYSRIRNIDSDYGRMQRQNNVIDAVLNSFSTQSKVGLLSVVNGIMPYIETNISNGSMKSYAFGYLLFDKELYQNQFPSQGYNSILTSLSLYGTGPHYVLSDFAGEVKILHDSIYEGNYTVSENVLTVDQQTKAMAGY